jgi:transposase, IS5 family
MELQDLIDWRLLEAALEVIPVAERGEAGWPPLALFKALLIGVWHDLSDVKLAEALEDRASFRRFCGFSRFEPTPERTAFVRFRSVLVSLGLDRVLFERVLEDLHGRAATIVTSQVPVETWCDVICDPTLADAIRDRLVQQRSASNSLEKA